MKEFINLYSNDLILRQLESNDYENYYEYVTDELISKQFFFNHTKESAKKRLDEILEKYNEDYKPHIWAIALKNNNEFIGIISIDTFSTMNKRFSIACGLRKKHRGHGYAYQAITALIDYAFKNLNMNRVELAHNIDNIASQKTIEKTGAKFEGIARESKFYDNKFKDRKIYSILKSEWEPFEQWKKKS